jgi:hypothetical protein
VNCGAPEPIRAGWLPRSHAVASKPHSANASSDRVRLFIAEDRFPKNLQPFCFQ